MAGIWNDKFIALDAMSYASNSDLPLFIKKDSNCKYFSLACSSSLKTWSRVSGVKFLEKPKNNFSYAFTSLLVACLKPSGIFNLGLPLALGSRINNKPSSALFIVPKAPNTGDIKLVPGSTWKASNIKSANDATVLFTPFIA